MKVKNVFLILCTLLFATVGCNNDGNKEEEAENKVKVDSSATNLLKIDNTIFSIPSPIQTALLIKKIGSSYSKEMLNNPKNVTNYSSNFKKGLNLGIYGADLAYINIFEQTQDAITYLSAVKKLSTEIGVSGAFDKKLIDRFEKNIGNKDSLLSLVSDAYRASDSYLKNNERNDVGALILAGGWVESLYFVTNSVKDGSNQEVLNRVCEQKSSLENLVKILTPFYDQTEFTEFIDALVDLTYEFDGINVKYIYEKPTTDSINKKTKINSKSECSITEKQLQTISQKIQSIRNQIVG